MKILKKISTFLLSLTLIGSFSTTPSKAEWIKLRSDVSREKVIENNKSNWSWAYSGAKMLEFLGVGNMELNLNQIVHSVGCGLDSDINVGIVLTLNAVRRILPLSHRLKKWNYLYLRGENRKLHKIPNRELSSYYSADKDKTSVRAARLGINQNEKLLLMMSLRDNIPILSSIPQNNKPHVVLITGLECSENKIRYWDSDIGEVEEEFIGGFSNKCTSYVTFGT